MILVLTGATGSGKTEMAIALAKKLNAVIINADAFQVYEELSIATAKPSEAQQMEVPHFLFSFIPLTESYNVAEYQKDLRACLAEFAVRKQNVIIAGGTGLYIRAGLYDYRFQKEGEPFDMSAYSSFSNEDLHEILTKMDPESAAKIHPNNRRRVLRAIEIGLRAGQSKSEWESQQNHGPIYEARFYGIASERAKLYEHCDARVEKMFAAGLIEENRALIEKYGRSPKAFQAIGVKECFPYFDGEITLEECKELIKQHTRNYIKRQDTFFRHQFDIHWIETVEDILEDLEK